MTGFSSGPADGDDQESGGRVDLSPVRRKKLTVDFGGGNQSSNGGLLLLRSAERKLGVCGGLERVLPGDDEGSLIVNP